jgi:methylation protein EvaC
MSACLACGRPISPFLSFGPMPIANGFLTPDRFAEEPFFELAVGFCEGCAMVQLTRLVDRSKLFHEEYPFFSSTSTRMAAHFERLADLVLERFAAPPDPFVVELGSNDGVLLRHVAARGVRHLGIEPARNVAEVAAARGVRTVSRFFDETLAAAILADDGPADAVIGANVICHIPYIHSVLKGISLLLKPDGVFIFEDPYLGDIVQKVSYDQIYDEHAFYFSVLSVRGLVAGHGLEVFDIAPQPVHGGSMRYFVARAGARPVSGAVERQRRLEEELGLGRPETYARLRGRIERSRDQLVALLRGLKADGKRVVGYGATSKSTTVTNYCGIGPDLVEFISDTTPAKQGRYSPGVHIPVRPNTEFVRDYPDYALLFAWNHRDEILEKEQAYLAAGGGFVEYVPTVRTTGGGPT